MPTLFSHALVGASLARSSPPGPSRAKLAWLLAALAVLPDLDVVGFYLGIPYGHAFGHRGFSHSLVFAALVGAGIALASSRRWPGLGLRLGALAALAVASHGILDALTSGGRGVGFLIPFSQERFFAPWRPIRVSPIGLDAFLRRGGVAALRSEITWIWLPLLLLGLGLRFGGRRWRARPAR